MSYERAFLCQAEPGNVSGSTFIERKQMSTKTTLKRIALVAVSALGFGLMTSVAPASATATASFSVDKSSITVVTNGTTAAEVTLGAIFKITLVDATGAAQTLSTDETLTARVVGVPAGTASTAKTVGANYTELTLTEMIPGSNVGNAYATGQTWTTGTTASGEMSFNSGDTAYNDNNTSTKVARSFFLGVKPTTGQDDVIDEGEYTIRLRLTSNDGALLVQDSTIKVRFVNGAVNSGAVLAAADAGAFPVATAHSAYSATKYINATLTDANGGRLIQETTAGSHDIPALTVDMLSSAGAVVTGSTGWSALDTATTADHGYATTTGTTDAIYFNGVYGITGTTASFPSAAEGSTNSVRVRYGAASATTAINITSTPSGTATTPVVIATGIPVLDVAPNWSLPLTTTTATVRFPGGTAGNAYSATVAFSSSTASGSRTPATSTPAIYYADASGNVDVAITNTVPVDGATATVTITQGFAGSQPDAQVITWRKSSAYDVEVDVDGAYIKTGSTTIATATVTDHFGAAVAGVAVVPSFSSGSEFYSATRTYAALTTNASGQVSYTWTDATAAADDIDAITFTVVGTSVSGTGTITYAAAAPAPTALNVYFNSNPDATQSFAAINTAVPTTGAYASGTTKFAVQIARNNSKTINPASSQDSLVMRVDGNVEGAKIVATGTDGVWFLNASNLVVNTLTDYADEFGDAYFVLGSTKSGANTVTFTAGAVTKTAAFWVDTTLGNARFVTLTGPATGTANGDLLNYAVAVTDRYGNAISGATVSISASGVAVLGGGSTVSTYTTDSTGAFTFTGTSMNAAGGAGSFKVSVTTGSTANDMTSLAGYSGATVVDSTVAAGNSSATATVTFTAGTNASQAAAEAASDAAAEAIDAANAATDAANLAAEAADAATVAAEEARDAADAATAAVEELATQVATLMAALKAQITTLANTVAKIAKKVRA